MSETSDNHIYYFLGNISSHTIHALPLYKELGGTFVVLSIKAKKEVERYGVPVIALDNKAYKWKKVGKKVKPIYHYLVIDTDLKKTTDFLNSHAEVVIFYELFDFTPEVRLTKPRSVFLTHGNMLKDYMGVANRRETLKQYSYMAALGPYLKKQLIKSYGVNPKKLLDVGIARTDEIYKYRGHVNISRQISSELGIDENKPIIAYLPTYWGPSSIYNTGKEIVRQTPNDYTLIFRPHPQTPKKLLSDYLKIIKSKHNVLFAPEAKYQDLGLLEVFAASSLIIGDVSSVMLDAILTEKPLVFAYDSDARWQQKDEYKSIQAVVENSQIISAKNALRIPTILKAALDQKINSEVWNEAEDLNYFNHDGTSVSALVNAINSMKS